MTKLKLIKFVKEQPVLFISFIAALITVFIIPPDKNYLSYFNTAVLIELFCLMIAVLGLRSVGLFERATSCLLSFAGNVRKLALIFVCVCFFVSMFVTNDVALITFVPLTLMVFSHIDDEKSRILTIVLETAAANLGSMLTPFGNPQNLFIYDKYQLSAADFFLTMLPLGTISLVMLLALCLLLPEKPCTAFRKETPKTDKARMGLYLFVFAVCLLTVFRLVPNLVCLLVATISVIIADNKLLIKVDYALLATFCCFFVFVGNVSRINVVKDFLSQILFSREVLISAVISQIISNVPAAVMLSGFTDNGKALLIGVNIGGLGTIIASLASIISFQFYRKSEGAKPIKYLCVFLIVNFAMLLVLVLVALAL